MSKAPSLRRSEPQRTTAFRERRRLQGTRSRESLGQSRTRGKMGGFPRLRRIELPTADHPILPRVCGKAFPEFLRYLDRQFFGGKMQLEER